MLKSEISERTLWVVFGAIATPLLLVLALANDLPFMPRSLATLVPLCGLYYLVNMQLTAQQQYGKLSAEEKAAMQRRVARNTVTGAFATLGLVIVITVGFALYAFAAGSYVSAVICALSAVPAMLGVRKLLV